MKPDVQKIFNKLNEKVELSTEKVDLSIETEVRKLVDDGENLVRKVIDLDNAVGKANDRFEQAKQALEKATRFNTDLQSEVSSDIRNGRKIQNDILKQLQKVESAAKELGISPRDAFPRYNNSIKVIDDLNKAIDKLDASYRKIK